MAKPPTLIDAQRSPEAISRSLRVSKASQEFRNST